ncbi:FliA/WhiG family RNA polymerase sigma factor [Lachnospiraceae bacterium 45-P1]
MQKGMEEMTNEELFVLYQKNRDPEIKQELTLRYLYLARSVAIQMNNLYSDFMQMEDIIHEGIIAIMKGIDRYDPERDSKFETFISRRIRGTVIDIIRQSNWVPRNYHKDRQSIENARQYLYEKQGRIPTDEEVAGYLKMNLKKFQRIQRMSTMVNVLSLDMITRGDETGPAFQVPSDDVSGQPEDVFVKGETVKTLIEAVDKLKEKEKLVISLYYVEELSMTQVAQILNVSEPRISQIHSEAIRKLKAYMKSHLGE